MRITVQKTVLYEGIWFIHVTVFRFRIGVSAKITIAGIVNFMFRVLCMHLYKYIAGTIVYLHCNNMKTLQLFKDKRHVFLRVNHLILGLQLDL